MSECLTSRLTSIAHVSQDLSTTLPLLERIACLFCCRLLSAREFRLLTTTNFPVSTELQNRLLELKEFLEFSSVRNDLYRALYTLSQSDHVDEYLVNQVARQNQLDPYDLATLWKRLEPLEIEQLRNLPEKPGKYSEDEILSLLHHIYPIIHNLVQHRLAFIANHDVSVGGRGDLVSLLRTCAIRVIREYEVKHLTEDHLLKNVVVSLKNFSANLAASYGRAKRSALRRVRVHSTTRPAWYLDIKTETVLPVEVNPAVSARIKEVDSLKVPVKRLGDEPFFLVHYKRLYATEQEALAALQLHRAGLYSKRRQFLALPVVEHDTFQATCVSMDAKDELGRPLLHHLPDTTYLPPDDHRELPQLGSSLLDNFAGLINHPEENEFFVNWCHQRGQDPSTCDLQHLSALAREFMGIRMQDLRQAVLATSASVWSDQAQRSLRRLKRVATAS